MKFVVLQRIKKLFKQTIVLSFLLSLVIYSWARILFYEVPFSINEDIPIIAKMTIFCWIMVLASGIILSVIFNIGEWIQRSLLPSSFNKNR
jgi:hypothetical protein